ncbi:MAG: helix-turn-helix domain-containing protein [Armatimonadia bacterium]|nr:helix-turn-helix domain-containing protein [Armatimonadia bacterium]
MPPKASKGTLLTVAEAAEVADVAESTIRRWVSKGKIEAVEGDEGMQVSTDELMRVGALKKTPKNAARPQADDKPETPPPPKKTDPEVMRQDLLKAQRERDEATRARDELKELFHTTLRALPPGDELDKVRRAERDARKELTAALEEKARLEVENERLAGQNKALHRELQRLRDSVADAARPWWKKIMG